MKIGDYPESEHQKLTQIRSLMEQWKASLPTEEQELFVPDGFFPYYFSKKPRILFIAKEALKISGLDYLETLGECYKTEKNVGNKHINQHRFHARILYMAYGILNGESSLAEFQAKPRADKIGDTFGTKDGVSFAFMNISKSSNDSGKTQANKPLMDASFKNGKDFIKREIEILEPDIIISGNVAWEYLVPIFGKPNILARIGGDGGDNCDVCAQTIKVNGKETLLLDCWHFTYIGGNGRGGKSDFENFYKPVCEFTKNYLNK